MAEADISAIEVYLTVENALEAIAFQVADVLSECLVLAADGDGGLVTLTVESPVANGSRVY